MSYAAFGQHAAKPDWWPPELRWPPPGTSPADLPTGGGGSATAEKGVAQHAALMAECLSRGGTWTGTSCLLSLPGSGPGPGSGGGGGGSVQALPPPSTRRAAIDPLLLAAAGAVVIVGGAWWWSKGA